MKKSYRTRRLLLDEVGISDAEFIMELVNTPGWIRFIGDRNIHTAEVAKAYIQKIIGNPSFNYWVVKISPSLIPIGIITFIKRDYLNHYDIGFAFLPEHINQGYAYEATKEVLDDMMNNPEYFTVLAVTVNENTRAIKLLEALGFHFANQIQNNDETLLVYAVAKKIGG